MMRDANHFLLMDSQSPLQLSRTNRETIQHVILPDTVDPLPARRQSTAHKVSSLPFTRAEGLDDLTLHVHDGDSVGTVTHHKLLCVPRQEMDTVNCDL